MSPLPHASAGITARLTRRWSSSHSASFDQSLQGALFAPMSMLRAFATAARSFDGAKTYVHVQAQRRSVPHHEVAALACRICDTPEDWNPGSADWGCLLRGVSALRRAFRQRWSLASQIELLGSSRSWLDVGHIGYPTSSVSLAPSEHGTGIGLRGQRDRRTSSEVLHFRSSRRP